MSRDPKRITPTLDIIKQIWKMHPDLRLSQLILNVKKPEEFDLYYVEDDELIKRITKLYSGDSQEIDNLLNNLGETNNANK